MYTCISRPSAPNEVMDISSIQNITIEELAKNVKLPNKMFSIKTPFYREELTNEIQPFISYPELILADKNIPKYPIPDFCLLIHSPPQRQQIRSVCTFLFRNS